MEQQTIPNEIRYLIPFAGWTEKHPVLTNIIIGVELFALAMAVLFYDFTTTI